MKALKYYRQSILFNSRDELVKVFKSAANLLREVGLQAGLDMFGAFRYSFFKHS
jgi:hypothetical protein